MVFTVTDLAEFVKSSEKTIYEMRRDSLRYSFQEYLSLALSQAITALEEGNYGIGAVYIFRHKGRELIVVGRNQMISRKNTHLHAEEDVISSFEGLLRGEKRYKSNVHLTRKAPHKKTEKILVTTIEPCIGCLRRIITHKVDSLFIGQKDLLGGAVLDDKHKHLPEMWKNLWLAQDTRVIIAKNFIPRKYLTLIEKAHLFNRDHLDKLISKKGLFNIDELKI